MVTTVLEITGIVLVAAAFVTLAVVAGSIRWEAGALVAAVESLGVGVLLIVLANRRALKVPS